MEELKALPDYLLNLDDEIDERFLSKYSLMTTTSVGGDIGTVVASVKNELTRSLGILMEDIYDEVLYGFEKEMPPCADWTEVDIQDVLVRIIALVSGRVFVGIPMSRDEEYLNCIIMFTMNVFYAVPKIRKYPSYLRWMSLYFSPEVKKVHKSLDTMRRLIKPIIGQNLKHIAEDTAPHNMSVWNLRNSTQKQRDSLDIQAQMQLSVSMASIHTTSMTVTNVIFDLAARPQYIGPLQEEIAVVKATETTPYLSKTSMPKLKKLDSFLKESHRVNPISLLNMRRKIKQDITLHDGTLLPAGSHIAFPLNQVSNDPQLWHEPEKFDGFRFFKLREQPGNESKFQFVTTGIDNLDFGHGTHACPGRFFASNEIKTILIHLLEHYDFKFKHGQERPESLWTPGGYHPDPSIRIMLKKKGTT
ncbi:MAG: hypothetical protein Q9164_006444 [Protoblastenia rupestris]